MGQGNPPQRPEAASTYERLEGLFTGVRERLAPWLPDELTPGYSPDRRTLLTALAAGTAGAAVANPGAVSDLFEAAPWSGSDGTTPLSLVPEGRVTHRAVASGDWDDPAVWEDGATPDDGARVLVPEDVSVRVANRVAARLETVRVDGTLTFAPDADTELPVETLVSTVGSTLRIGTADEPVAPDRTARVTFLDRGPIDEERDPDRLGRGLIVMGAFAVHGAETTPWTALAEPPRAGDRTLSLPEPPTNWSPGDEVVLAGIDPLEDRDERVRVASVDGSTVRLDRPLEHDHVPPEPDLPAYVVHLTRNVEFASENRGTPRRGHVMIHSASTTVRYAGCYGLGRTDKSYPFTNPQHGTPPEDVQPNPRARYALHFHVTGTDVEPAHLVEGCVVDGSPGWGVVNHHSHVDVVDSVTYDVLGAGFVAEAGDERGSFRRNFALRSAGSGELPDSRAFAHRDGPGHVDDFGHGGHGFWMQGPLVAVEGNVAAGHRHHAYAFWNRPLIDRPLEADEEIRDKRGTVPNVSLPTVEGQAPLRDSRHVRDDAVSSGYLNIRSFSDNTAFASGGGLDVSRHMFRWPHARYDEYGTIDGFTAYAIGPLERDDGRIVDTDRGNAQGGNVGISVRYSVNVRVRNARLIGRGPGVGINRNTPYAENLVVEDSIITGWEVGVRPTERGETVVRSNELSNQVNVEVTPEGERGVLITGNEFDARKTAQVELEPLDFDRLGPGELFEDDWRRGVEIDGRTAYYPEQAPAHVPVPNGRALRALADDEGERERLAELVDGDPKSVVGRTNRELLERYGIAVDGALLPEHAEPNWRLSGGRLESAPGERRPEAVWLDAERGSLGELFSVGADPNTASGSYVVVEGAKSDDEPPVRGGVATYEFDVAPGTYRVFARIHTPRGHRGSQDSLWVRVDGGEWRVWDGLRASRGWTWRLLDAPDRDVPATFDLEAGTHTLELGYRGAGVEIDRLLVAADATTPVGPGNPPTS
jgi:hypothetical protein